MDAGDQKELRGEVARWDNLEGAFGLVAAGRAAGMQRAAAEGVGESSRHWVGGIRQDDAQVRDAVVSGAGPASSVVKAVTVRTRRGVEEAAAAEVQAGMTLGADCLRKEVQDRLEGKKMSGATFWGTGSSPGTCRRSAASGWRRTGRAGLVSPSWQRQVLEAGKTMT